MNIEKLKLIHIGWGNDGDRTYEPIPIEELAGKINELVEAVNEIKAREQKRDIGWENVEYKR